MRKEMAFNIATESRTVSRYFKALGIRSAEDGDKFWLGIGKKFGTNTRRQLESIIEARTDSQGKGDIYSAKNKNLALTIEFARWSTDLYRGFLEWFVGYVSHSPRAILDVGCDNGIVTCFYAWKYPEASVVGMDSNAFGIECARELAKQIGLTNVKFIESDIGDAEQYCGKGYFDVVTSLRSFNEVIGIPQFPPHWRKDDIPINPGPPEQALLGVRSVMDNNGVLITADRFYGPLIDGTVWWAKKLSTIGLNIDWQTSDWLSFHEVGYYQSMPVIVAGHAIPSSSIVDGAIALHLKESGAFPSSEQSSLDGLGAELRFDDLSDKQLVQGVEVDLADMSGRVRIEVWKHSYGVVMYQYSNTGIRKIDCYDTALLQQVLSIVEEELENSPYRIRSTSERYTNPRM